MFRDSRPSAHKMPILNSLILGLHFEGFLKSSIRSKLTLLRYQNMQVERSNKAHQEAKNGHMKSPNPRDGFELISAVYTEVS